MTGKTLVIGPVLELSNPRMSGKWWSLLLGMRLCWSLGEVTELRTRDIELLYSKQSIVFPTDARIITHIITGVL